MTEGLRIAVVISADAEWRATRAFYPDATPHASPLGEWFSVTFDSGGRSEPVLFFHGGWGKTAAAAATQYLIDRWSPQVVMNLGTCGGLEGEIERGTVILAQRTVIYDVIEQMGDAVGATAHYSTDINPAWLGHDYPQDVLTTLLVSADRDLRAEDIPRLKAELGAVAGDWESGAIAYVAARNDTRCLILRGVTDLSGPQGGETDGRHSLFIERTNQMMDRLLRSLPAWIDRIATVLKTERRVGHAGPCRYGE